MDNGYESVVIDGKVNLSAILKMSTSTTIGGHTHLLPSCKMVSLSQIRAKEEWGVQKQGAKIGATGVRERRVKYGKDYEGLWSWN